MPRETYREWQAKNTDAPVLTWEERQRKAELTGSPIKSVPGGFADGDGSIRGVEPTITALWAAVNVLQQDVAELQREIFQGEDGE